MYPLSQPAFKRLFLTPTFCEASRLSRVNAICRSLAMFSAACPIWMLDSSSRNATSRTQWRPFSTPQCSRTARTISSAEVEGSELM